MKQRSFLPNNIALRRIVSMVVIAAVTAIVFLINGREVPTEPFLAEELPLLMMNWMLGCEDPVSWDVTFSTSIMKGLPLWAFLCFFGSLVYWDWTGDQVYVICRLKSRKKRYLGRCLQLMLYACATATIYIAELLAFLWPQMKALPLSALASSVARIWISVCGICFSFALLQSLISLLYGSAIGFLSSSALWCLSMMLVPTYLFWSKPNLAWYSITSVYTAAYLGLSHIASIGWMLASVVLHSGILIGIGMALVKRCDLGLTDQEAI